MTELVNTEKRQLVPRWHESDFGFNHTKWVEKTPKDPFRTLREFEVDFSAWTDNKSIATAVELTEKLHNFAIDLPVEKQKLRSYLSKNLDDLPLEVRFLIGEIDDRDTSAPSELIEIQSRIRNLRKKIRSSESDPLAWHDLAFNYSILNQDKKAEKCLTISLNLSRKNAFIARSFSRFLVHQSEPDKAVRILKSLGSNDPRIVGAELAIRARFEIGKPNIKLGLKLLDRYKSSPGVISELAATLGTVDCLNGHVKRAKKHLEMALTDYTENVEAQIRWLLQRFKSDLPVEIGSTLTSPEATAIDLYERNMLLECRNSLEMVYKFQPFSAASLVDSTFLSTVLGDYESVIRILREYEFAMDLSLIHI